MFYFSAAAIALPAYWDIFPDLRLVAMNGSKLILYFPHSDTSGRSQLDDALASAMAVFTFPLRTFYCISASFISALLDMAYTSQVCSEVDCNPGSAGSWLMKFGLTCYLIWKGGGATGFSGFLYYFSIRLMLATSISFCVTISHFPSSSYLPSASKYFSSRVRLFFFQCTGSSLLDFFSAKFQYLLNHFLLL